MEKESESGAATWSLLFLGPTFVAVVQLSAGKEVALGGSVLFASMGPSVGRVALSERAKVHVLSLDCNTSNIPSLRGQQSRFRELEL